MKYVRIPCIVLAALLALSLVNSAAIDRRCADWLELVEASDAAAVRSAWDQADELLAELQTELDRCSLWLHVVLSHDMPDQAASLLDQARLMGTLRQTAHMRRALAELRGLLEQTAEGERLSLGNIM
jgi:hypothetical protein